ncbi:MAG: hypothetical protein NUW37_13210, partial [Planctomycetes bacterium]|nr:hypothetical protein [Planctomycetota bacterium]
AAVSKFAYDPDPEGDFQLGKIIVPVGGEVDFKAIRSNAEKFGADYEWNITPKDGAPEATLTPNGETASSLFAEEGQYVVECGLAGSDFPSIRIFVFVVLFDLDGDTDNDENVEITDEDDEKETDSPGMLMGISPDPKLRRPLIVRQVPDGLIDFAINNGILLSAHLNIFPRNISLWRNNNSDTEGRIEINGERTENIMADIVNGDFELYAQGESIGEVKVELTLIAIRPFDEAPVVAEQTVDEIVITVVSTDMIAFQPGTMSEPSKAVDTENKNNPLSLIALVNNDVDDPAATVADNSDNVIKDEDDDIVQILLFIGIPDSVTQGTIRIEEDSGGSIRFFKPDGQSLLSTEHSWETISTGELSGDGAIWSSAGGIVSIFVEGMSASDDVTVTLSFKSEGGLLITKSTFHMAVISADLDIDTDNNDATKRTLVEDRDEDRIDPAVNGKIILVNNDDNDFDGIQDWADGFNRVEATMAHADYDRNGVLSAEERATSEKDDENTVEIFTLIQIEFSPGTIRTNAHFRIEYDESDPDGMADMLHPDDVSLRIWAKPGNEARSSSAINDPAGVGDFIPSEHVFTWDELSARATINGNVVHLWIEGVKPSTKRADLRILVQMDPDMEGPLNFIDLDAIRLTSIMIETLYDTTHAPVVAGAPLPDPANFVRIGLWDHAFTGPLAAAGAFPAEPDGLVRNPASPGSPHVGNPALPANAAFIEEDTRRFYFRITNPLANTNTGAMDTVNDFLWLTQRPRRDSNVAGPNFAQYVIDPATGHPEIEDDDNSGNTDITLLETDNDSGVFVSEALMLVTGDADLGVEVFSNHRAGSPGNVSRNSANFRLRRTGIEGIVTGHLPVAGVNLDYSVPVFNRERQPNVAPAVVSPFGDERRVAPLHIFVMNDPTILAGGGAPNGPVLPYRTGGGVAGLSDVHLPAMRRVYSRIGVDIRTVSGAAPPVPPAVPPPGAYPTRTIDHTVLNAAGTPTDVGIYKDIIIEFDYNNGWTSDHSHLQVGGDFAGHAELGGDANTIRIFFVNLVNTGPGSPAGGFAFPDVDHAGNPAMGTAYIASSYIRRKGLRNLARQSEASCAGPLETLGGNARFYRNRRRSDPRTHQPTRSRSGMVAGDIQ